MNYSYVSVPTIQDFRLSPAFICGLMGPFGSGKSSGCVAEIVERSRGQAPDPKDGIRKSRWAVVRNTYRQLSDTTMKTFFDWLPPLQYDPLHGFGDFIKTDHNYLITGIEGCLVEVWFRALDRPEHVANLLSSEYTGAWFNEAREIDWTIVEAMTSRVGRFPAKKDGGCTWSGIFMDTNPPDDDSDWYNFFEEKSLPAYYSQVFKQPSGTSPEAENLPKIGPFVYREQ